MQDRTPQTYLIGSTGLDRKALKNYLYATGQEGFLNAIYEAEQSFVDGDGLKPAVSDMGIMCSVYAKLCYAALTPDRNENITRTRSIRENIINTLHMGHGSVFEHVSLNFITTHCSRVFMHELVRHRAGTAFSQTSGRYVRPLELDAVLGDPVLQEIVVPDPSDPSQSLTVQEYLGHMLASAEHEYQRLNDAINWDPLNRDQKKRLTSALRRMLPEGRTNEIGWSINIRALRHVIQMRTSEAAEWEIRTVFNQVYHIVKDKCPELFFDAEEVDTGDGLLKIRGMTTQPYDHDRSE